MSLAAIILAAGEGKRIGIPKAILKVGGRSLADIQYENLKNLGIPQIKIVIGAEGKKVKREIRNVEAIVVNENYKYGQFSSLLKGISSLDSFLWLIVLPVDVYPIDNNVINELISGCEDGYDAIAPVFNGKGGHPVILYWKFAKRLLTFDIKLSRLDSILKDSKVKRIEVKSSTILNNINCLSDFQFLSQ